MLIKSRDVVKKIAIVPKKKTYECVTGIDKLFAPWQERYFDIDEMEKAWGWHKEE